MADKELAAAKELVSTDPKAAISKLRNIIFNNDLTDADTVKIKEQTVQALAEAYVAASDAKALSGLLSELRQLGGEG